MTPSIRTVLCTLTFMALAACHSQAQQPVEMEDGWESEREEGLLVRTRKLVVHPKEEPKPALRYQLLPNELQYVRGNAAIYYLKAMGFLEQTAAREQVSKFIKNSVALAQAEGKDIGDLPPYSWLETAPHELPIEEVNEYLSLLAFQPPIIREGARRDRFDMNRNYRDVDDPIGYLLPEIQNLRQLARDQSVRCRLAIAEGRIDDAIEIVGQQFCLARHLGHDDFLVSNLVGIAIAGIAWNDAMYLLEQAETPNLYWALATMPTPLVDMRRSMAVEREFLYQQVKVLREVSETPRPEGYWQDFIDRMLPQIGTLSSDLNIPSFETDPDAARATVVGYVAAGYPGAKDYLITEQKMTKDQVEAYPTAQVVFLAMVGFYDQWRDEYFKWAHLPIWQSSAKMKARELDKAMFEAANRYGLCASPTRILLPAVRAARSASARCDQNIAMLRLVEALRMYAADHQGKLPPTLDHLTVPAPVEPFTGKPVEYELIADHALITGHKLPGLQYRLVVSVAD